MPRLWLIPASLLSFGALAEAAVDAGLEVLGYTTQAQFLVNCGITEVLGEANVDNALHYAPLDPQRYPEVNRSSGEAFRLACNQCHVLPDPKRHTAAEWRAVVARMQENMEWMNRVVGSKPVPGEPALRVEEINAFLARYAKKP